MPDQPYTDEDAVLAAEVAHRVLDELDDGWHFRCLDPDEDGPSGCSKGWAARRMLAEDVMPAVLTALAAAGRLVPPGSEVREDWSVVFGPDDALDCSSEERARQKVARHGGTVEKRRVITTPWAPAEPITDQPAPTEDQ